MQVIDREQIEQAKREELRWLILQTLYMAQEIGASEIIVKNAVEAVILDVTTLDVRRAFDYLSERKLISMIRKEGPVWSAKINRYGIDVVEYTLPCEPGIKRPERW